MRPKQLEIFEPAKLETKVSPRHFLSTENGAILNENSFEKQRQIFGEQHFSYERSSQKKRQAFNFMLEGSAGQGIPEDQEALTSRNLDSDLSPIAAKNLQKKAFQDFQATTASQLRGFGAGSKTTAHHQDLNVNEEDEFALNRKNHGLNGTEEFTVNDSSLQKHSFLDDNEDLDSQDKCFWRSEKVSQSVQTEEPYPIQQVVPHQTL